MNGPENQPALDQIAEIRRRAAQVNAEIARVRGRADGANGSVTVEIDANGSLQNLRLTPQALRLGHDRLAEVIMSCYRKAQGDVQSAVRIATRGIEADPRVQDARRFVAEFLGESDEGPKAGRPADPDDVSWIDRRGGILER